MLDAVLNLPMWLIKTLAAVLGLGLVLLVGILISGLFRKLTDRLPLD